MKLSKLARSLALVGIGTQLAAAALAQTDTVQKVERVEVTGSSIKRVQDEGALPIQVIRGGDLVKLGITSAEQLVSQLGANGNGIDNMTANQGGDFLNSTADRRHNNGAAGASLRGLGAQYTLVLLNGRRISTHGLSGKSVDLNSIPMAAVDRIEILKDGASAIYGTDAIGGVINFILKKDVKGLEGTLFTDRTQHGGGNITRASLLFGAGDLGVDRFNFMASLTYDTNDRLRGGQRSFHNGFQPERGLAMDTTGTPYANIGAIAGSAIPSSVRLPGDTVNSNRFNVLSFQGKCDIIADQSQYQGAVTGFTNANHACAWDYGRAWSLMQPVDRSNLVSRGSFALSNTDTAYVELNASRTKSAVEYTPIQLTGLDLPNTSPYYQNLAVLLPTMFRLPGTVADGRAVFDPSKGERVRWRCMPCGSRQQDTTTDAYRLLAGFEGTIASWDYKLGLSTARSKAKTILGDGMMYTDKLNAAFLTGKINPFLMPGESQTAEAMQLIESAKAKGTGLYNGIATVKEIDGTISGELFKLPAGVVSAAAGFDLRKEDYRFQDDQHGAGLPAINGVTSPATLNNVGRDIKAVFGELYVPLAKGLDMQLALRYDKYNDFGSTTNPKAAIRWQPMSTLAFRGSYSTGFHAPDFDPLYGGDGIGQFNSDINDPVLCPNGTGPTTACLIRPGITTKSNPNLKPEKSKQFSVGVVVQPAPWLTASLDYWNLELTDRIGYLSGQLLISRYDQYKQYVIRKPDGTIDHVESPYLNLAGDKVRGYDLSVSAAAKNEMGRWVASFDGTYLDSFKSRFSSADVWTDLVGNFGNTTYGFDLHVRWKHSLSLTWSDGPWSVTGSQSYTGGYRAGGFDGFAAVPAAAPTRIDSYTLYHLSASYSGYKNLTLTAGIKNLFDTKPPFSAHNIDNVAGAGWDSRVGDPRLRSLTLRANYKFW